jgi:predicted RNase H-like HicB family nuclease
MIPMEEITFTVEQEEDGGYVASWNDPAGGGITTQGDTLADLQHMILDAVSCHFEPERRPARVLLHFASDVAMATA